jgi:hypothetical protein
MIIREEYLNFIDKQLQALANTPLVAFIITSVTVAIVVWVFRGWLAKRGNYQLRYEMAAEDEVLKLAKEKHAHEVELRVKIEECLERFESVVERVHGADTVSDHLIDDATVAIEKAMAELRSANKDFVLHMKSWDQQHVPRHRPVTQE